MTTQLMTALEMIEACAEAAAIQRRNPPTSPAWQHASERINRLWPQIVANKPTDAQLETLSPEGQRWARGWVRQ